jgi:23S rRNA (pseudouridine1915-N3)-methyltransferase
MFSDADVKVMARDELTKIKGDLWLCDTYKGAKMLSSEQMSEELNKKLNYSAGDLTIAIGPHDGFTKEQRNQAKLLWSFGPLTFPHELAALVACEQLYRAWTILKKHPYHLGH